MRRCSAAVLRSGRWGVLCQVPLCRAVASYPVPKVRHHSRVTKKYNYLSGERLLHRSGRKLTRKLIKLRDDKGLQSKVAYREQLLRNIDTKIKYYPDIVKHFVFFPLSRTVNRHVLFKGNRTLFGRTYVRIVCLVINQLKAYKNRTALKEGMTKAGIAIPPESEWKRYCDKEGNVKIGIFYSMHMRQLMSDLSRHYLEITGKTDRAALLLPPLQAYLLTHLEELQSLEEWSAAKGEITEEDLRDSLNTHASSVKRKMERLEVRTYGEEYVKEKVRALSYEEQRELCKEATERLEELFGEYRRQSLFAAQVLLGICTLPEVIAIQSAKKNFILQTDLRNVIDTNGVGYPPVRKVVRMWSALSPEEKATYFCFGRHSQATTRTGGQLYTRFCSRDYGIGRTEATTRYKNLTDQQQAAVNFPFYDTIAPPSAAKLAYRRFYLEMSRKYGLIRGTNVTFGNRFFESAMRKKWLELTPEERWKYDDVEVINAAFPLQPSSSSKSDTAAPPSPRLEEPSEYTQSSTEIKKSGTKGNGQIEKAPDEGERENSGQVEREASGQFSVQGIP
ncbi:hypothetical protein AGDE_12797 [Angomonas deanei]|uniref:Uncharacterized protein n=1 Tax=Angomonas deanei TaxID=59799 RepID=A0A7G2CJ19_9TRYP|nr:hypothetical protein AGDE_12797 [Angomonas deanei]CAD2218941.1 hypothetical protein, conserved [Angomonas deanei]|eukprot:EPY23457.1 hypothetical protein AGDE_12797 [Angomonas deanei]